MKTVMLALSAVLFSKDSRPRAMFADEYFLNFLSVSFFEKFTEAWQNVT